MRAAVARGLVCWPKSELKQGGHGVAESVIRRRFAAGMRNFLDIYKYRVDDWILFDNSGLEPLLIDEGENT